MAFTPRGLRTGLMATGVSLALTACGGGDGGGASNGHAPTTDTTVPTDAQGGDGLLFASVSYDSVEGLVGQSFTRAPKLSGFPASASLTFQATDLPAGMRIDASTGVISGTPTAESLPHPAHVTVTARGYSGQVSNGVFVWINLPTLFNWTLLSSNTVPTGQAAPLPNRQRTRLMALGNTLYATGPNSAGTALETWRSTDQGAHWQAMNLSPTPSLQLYALATTTNAVYLLGGSAMQTGLSTNQVWRFDGSAWMQVSVATPFSARRRLAATAAGDTLYVIGGSGEAVAHRPEDESASGYLNDVWRSTDGGVHWTQLTEHAAFTPRQGHCAVARGNTLHVVGGYDTAAARNAWASSDGGATWQQTSGDLAQTFDFAAGASCVVHNDRILVIAGGTCMNEGTPGWQTRICDGVSWSNELKYSADGGVNWRANALSGNVFASTSTSKLQGAAVLGSQLILLGSRSYDNSMLETWQGLPR